MEVLAIERERVWQDLLCRYNRRMLAYARRTNCSWGEAQELVQDAWSLVALDERALFASDDPWPMLRSAVCAVCTERVRVWARERTADSIALLPAPADTGDSPEYFRALRDWWTAASLALPKSQRLAVDFRYRWGWSFPEIADALGVAEATARGHVARGMRKLREVIAEPPPQRTE